jgi:hypothetical protein
VNTLDLLGIGGGLIVLGLFITVMSHAMSRPRRTPKPPRGSQRVQSQWGVGIGPFWFWF